ncbi:50S ribosomal protein L6 [Rickettsiales bacterium]|nr:50S ribosomal protein L6 [Rickettsiales bacterium]
MSRIGKLPINIDSKVNVTIENSFVTIKSGQDEVNYKLNNCVDAVIEDNQLKLKASSASVPKATMFVGLDRSNLNNIITGFINPFKTILEVNGVGYKFIINQKRINFSLGYSHEIIYILPDLVNAQFEKPNMLILTSRSKDLLGKVASEIMSFRKTEPYKGKGIKIKNSFTRRKDGKKK